MRNFFSGKVRYLDWRTSALDVKRKAMRCLLILLFLGIISGSLFGLFSEKATAAELLSFAAENWSYESVWKALLFAAKDFLLLFFEGVFPFDSASGNCGFTIKICYREMCSIFGVFLYHLPNEILIFPRFILE